MIVLEFAPCTRDIESHVDRRSEKSQLFRLTYLTRFNKITIRARAQMAADKEGVGLSRVHMNESKCILPLRDNCIFCSYINILFSVRCNFFSYALFTARVSAPCIVAGLITLFGHTSSPIPSSTCFVRLETDGREETGCTGQYGSGVRRPGESV